MLKLTISVLEEIKEGQRTDLRLVDRLALINQDKGGEFIIYENGVIRLRDMICVSDVPELKKSILKEGHRSGLSIHPSVTNMYRDLRKIF